MTACLLAAGVALAVQAGFTLSWTHSVERVEWRESWRVEGSALHLMEARVRGSGAGMEPGDGAVLSDGWWAWQPDLRTPELRLAASGATGEGWTLCTDTGCRKIGLQAGRAAVLRPCPAEMAGD